MSTKHAGQQVGVRELRQNLSVYLDQVKRGARLEVTEHGRPVAQLVPLSPPNDALARLVAEGRARPAARTLEEALRRYPPRLPLPDEGNLTQILAQMRDEEER